MRDFFTKDLVALAGALAVWFGIAFVVWAIANHMDAVFGVALSIFAWVILFETYKAFRKMLG